MSSGDLTDESTSTSTPETMDSPPGRSPEQTYNTPIKSAQANDKESKISAHTSDDEASDS